jgi:large subunit ribosomal protein L31
MKAKIHPDYHKITVVMTDGTKYETRSTWGKEGDVLTLDVDPKTHPAWVGGINLRKTGQMEKFTNKFAFLDRPAGGAAAPKKDAAPAAPAGEKKEAKAEVKAEAKPAAAPKAEKKAEKKEKKEEPKA